MAFIHACASPTLVNGRSFQIVSSTLKEAHDYCCVHFPANAGCEGKVGEDTRLVGRAWKVGTREIGKTLELELAEVTFEAPRF